MIAHVLFAFVIGALLGNFATTALHRLPNRLPLSGDKKSGIAPHCSACSHPLRFYEYLPILSWVFARGHCNYCGAPINPEYTIIELYSSLLAVLLCFLIDGFSENYILLLIAGVTFILYAFMLRKTPESAQKIAFALFFIGAVYRTLNDHDIYHWIISFTIAYCVYALSATWDRVSTLKPEVILLAGVWLCLPYFIVYTLCILLIQRLNITKDTENSTLIAILYASILTSTII